MRRLVGWLLFISFSCAGDVAALQGGVVEGDACADAIVVSTNQFQQSTETTTATTDPGDPIPSCGNHSRADSVWYRFTAPSGGIITANTFDSSYDTILSAFSGSCDSLTPAPDDCDDDHPSEGTQSQVAFVAEAGVTYYFMITAFDDDADALMFRLTLQDFPVCVGDCNHDGVVGESECDLCSRIRGGEPLSLCPACDADGNGSVAIGEINSCELSNFGCIPPTPGGPDPTPTATTTPTPTPRRQTDDCDGDARVAANDIVRLVAILTNCPCSAGAGAEAAGCVAVPGSDKQCVSADVDMNGCLLPNDLARATASLFE